MGYVLCCSREQDTRFCGECGKRLRQEGSLEDLLVYLRGQQRRYEGMLKGFLDANKGKEDEYVRKKKVRKEAIIRKWKGWADTIDQIIREFLTPEPDRQEQE